MGAIFGSDGDNRLRMGVCLALLCVFSFCAASVTAQTFDSGSDGSDLALVVPPNQGTILFDPTDVARWGRVLDPDGDGVYHFTTITIGAGSILSFRADKVSTPIHWLATGDVVISPSGGTNGLSLTGEGETTQSQLVFRRQASVPGSGGYAGGLGGQHDSPALAAPATPGEGPGGGSGGSATGGSGNCSTRNVCGISGVFTGNRYLIPMIGGSGGEGAFMECCNGFRRGGAGGGAILIASSTSITVNGTIAARGGGSGFAGAGSGGAIRLVAPVVAGGGTLDVSGGAALAGAGGPGWVRLEGFNISTNLNFPAGISFVTRGAPVDSSTLVPSGFVRVVAVAGIPVPVYPSGTFALPDVAINTGSAVNVEIQASGIPPGTVVTLRVMADTPADLTGAYLPEVQATLQGTLELSTATVPFTFPYGFSRGQVRARWTQ